MTGGRDQTSRTAGGQADGVLKKPHSRINGRGEPAYKRWYRLSRWQKLRARQLAKEPLCEFCRPKGRLEPATVCDHITPHRGNEEMFWAGPFQSLCRRCHNTDKKLIENGKPPPVTIGLDGWPL